MILEFGGKILDTCLVVQVHVESRILPESKVLVATEFTSTIPDESMQFTIFL
jgi:hypothetical protein